MPWPPIRAIRAPARILRTPVVARRAAASVGARLLASFRSANQEAGDSEGRFLTRALRAVVLPLSDAYGRLLRRFSAPQVFVPTDRIEWVRQLESNWQVIREELERLRAGFELPALLDLIPGERYVADVRWRMFVFHYYGRPVAENRALCPRTAALLDQVPGLVSANFSVLQPQARIAPHRAMFAGVLRYHLGVIVPATDDLCAIRVGGQTRHWREGGSLLFDDTNEHEAWNLSDGDRVVLLLDVKRPLPGALGWLNDGLLRILARTVMQPLARADRMVATERGWLRRAGAGRFELGPCAVPRSSSSCWRCSPRSAPARPFGYCRISFPTTTPVRPFDWRVPAPSSGNAPPAAPTPRRSV